MQTGLYRLDVSNQCGADARKILFVVELSCLVRGGWRKAKACQSIGIQGDGGQALADLAKSQRWRAAWFQLVGWRSVHISIDTFGFWQDWLSADGMAALNILWLRGGGPLLVKQPVGFFPADALTLSIKTLRFALLVGVNACRDRQLEVINGQECLELINYATIIPGDIEVGTFPINIFLAIAEQLEAVCLHFLEHHRPVKFDAYHRRALAFCCERLGSYLLQKALHEIFDNTIPEDVIGYMHTVDIGSTEYRAGI